ncbi:MAG: hypothetical protein GXP55_24825 [Deltaproteobacteria bacterium]|nr:hypothetical protein [Deltaproteobacteria bacterium]
MRDDNETKIGRRAAMKRSLLVLGAAAIAPAALAACGSEEGGGGSANACADTAGLSAADLSTRTTNAYVDPGPDAAKHCAACALYVAPAGGAPCGTCPVVKGPIATTGTCTAFVAKPS